MLTLRGLRWAACAVGMAALAAGCGKIEATDAPFAVSGPDGLVAGRINTQLTIDVQLERLDGFAGEVTITADTLPDGVSADTVTIPAGEDTATLTLDIASTADPGARTDIQIIGSVGEASAAASVDLLVLGLTGELDPSFGEDGFAASPEIAGVPLAATTLIALDDGSLLVGGEAGSTMAVVKFTAEGEIDTAFGDNGVFVQDFAELSLEINNGGRLGVQSDGRIILGGDADSDPDMMIKDFVVVLVGLTPDGQLDPTFEGEGRAILAFGNDSVTLTSINVFSDDEVYLGAQLRLTDAIDALVVKLTPDGQIDNGFAIGGQFARNMETNDNINRVTELADGSLLVSGVSNQGLFDFLPTPFLLKLSAGGDLDTDFGVGGEAHLGETSAFFGPVLETGPGLVLAGSEGPFLEGQLSVWGTDDAGERSAAFAVNGEVTVVPSGANISEAVNMFPIDDTLTVIGLATFTDLSSTSVVTCRFDLTGTLDESLGDEGLVLTSIPNGAFPTDAVLQGGIRYVTANNKASTPFFLMRLFL